MENGVKKESGLAYIATKSTNPFDLFDEWLQEAKSYKVIDAEAVCFSTCTNDGRPSSRHVLIRRIEDDGFVIMTDRRSKKARELEENPFGSMSVFWAYMKNENKINRQVRMDGRVIELDHEEHRSLYDREPLYCKIRAHICLQGQAIDWTELKKNHDNIYNDVSENGQLLPLPNHVAFYKLIPEMMEFYYAFDTSIADRLMFLSNNNDATNWTCQRIAA